MNVGTGWKPDFAGPFPNEQVAPQARIRAVGIKPLLSILCCRARVTDQPRFGRPALLRGYV